MPTSAITIEPLTPTIGATVHGVDLTEPLDEETFRFIYDAWMEHLVLFFHDQPMTPDQHLDFGRRFGDLHIHPAAPYVHGNPELMQIYTDKDSFRNNGERWHSDVSADEEPPMASILHIHQIPTKGGDTCWSNMYAAWDGLSPQMQALLEPLTALHASDYSGQYGDHKPQRESPRAVHPIARTHPVTGRKALFVNSSFTRRIVELPIEESDAILAFLYEHVKNVNFQCRFQWGANSVALWDNRCTQHMAIWDYYPESRSGIRVTIKGDKPF